jgi:DmsE family decaheme c-type cytochrome
MSHIRRWTSLLAAVGIGLALPYALPAQDLAAAKTAERSCTKCHDEGDKHQVLSILATKHAVMGDPRTPYADQACITCHGPSEAHLDSEDDENRAKPDYTFASGSAAPGSNEVCLTCHERGERTHWKGSPHETANVACSSCHQVHAQQDLVADRDTQSDVCYGCHKDVRAANLRPFRHPVHEGKVACSDCHSTHGSASGKGLLTKATLNETCYTCHAEKRGPFLWEHAPAREDCSSCHTPHGSVHQSMLKARGPWLCQQCHLAPQHPSTAYSGSGLPGATRPSGAQQMLGRNCMNCHPYVHGSNHPSGVRKTQ